MINARLNEIAKNDNTRKQILYEEIQKESYGLKLISLYLYIKCTIYVYHC